MVKKIGLASACMFVTIYIYIWCTYCLTTNTMPTHIVYTLNLLLTLHTGNQITIETVKVKRKRLHKGLSKINICYYLETRTVLLIQAKKDMAATFGKIEEKIIVGHNTWNDWAIFFEASKLTMVT